jgi:hypothetical protein
MNKKKLFINLTLTANINNNCCKGKNDIIKLFYGNNYRIMLKLVKEGDKDTYRN